MSDNTPALVGTVVPNPNEVVPQADTRAHAFFNVVRDLLHSSHAFHSEANLDAALNAVNAFETHLLSGPLSRVVSEGDRAAKEDVSKRVPPPVGTGVVPAAAGPAIDYNKLAAAIVAVQNQQAQQAQAPVQTYQEGPAE